MQPSVGSSSPITPRTAVEGPALSRLQPNRKKLEKNKKKKSKTEAKKEVKSEWKRKIPRSRQQVIIIPVSGIGKDSYADVAKKLKKGVDTVKLGMKVSQMKEGRCHFNGSGKRRGRGAGDRKTKDRSEGCSWLGCRSSPSDKSLAAGDPGNEH